MKGPRDYSAGTERALFSLANGTCYFPACEKPVIDWVDSEPVVAVEIAHIRGARQGSARFDPSMTDEQRRAFSNLIFLCTVHHKVVDRISPSDYPAAVLVDWKVANEGKGADELGGGVLADETAIERLLTDVLRRFGPRRQVRVRILAGLPISPIEYTMADFEAHAQLLAHNPHVRDKPPVVIVEVANTGSLAVEVTSVDLHWNVRLPGVAELASQTLKGRDDFPGRNPRLPHRLLDGARLTWLTTGGTIRDNARVQGFVSLHAEVGLATGESAKSEPVSRDDLEAVGLVLPEG